MTAFSRSISMRAPGLNAVLLALLLVVLWVAGGASRPEAGGQVLVRGACWVVILVAVLAGRVPDWRRARGPILILVAAILIVGFQLIPLPPGIWQALPGRARFVEAAILVGQPQPWRPLAIVPDAAANALASLVVPAAVILLVTGLKEADRAWLPSAVLALIVASALIGVLQFSGAGINNPLVNFSPGDVSGTFANRNHFALVLAMGCLLAPAWAYMGNRRPGWRPPVALGLVLLFVLIILGAGSRAGILLAGIGLAAGLLLARHGIRRALGKAPRWVTPAILFAIVGIVVVFAFVSIAADRALSLDRIVTMRDEHDMRARGLPVVLAMIRLYFPVGSGFGGFDPMFRLHEPFNLLKPTYFNHAHNDFAEVVLDGGLPGLLLLGGSLVWWAVTSLRVWRARDTGTAMLPRIGAAMLLQVLVASVVDYPARTPLMMAMITIAALWLSQDAVERPTLPKRCQHL